MKTVQDDNKEFLKISEAANLLGVSQKTVYRWIKADELPATQMGGLFLIRRDDLNMRLDRRGSVSVQGDVELRQEILKCGSCFQIIQNTSQLGGQCANSECGRNICTSCAQKGIRYCLNHRPTNEQAWRSAEDKLEKGEYQLVVKSPNARQGELIYLNRLDARLSQIKSLMHPQTSELINIASWEQVRESSDEQARLLKLLNKMFLDSTLLMRYPLNAAYRYRLPVGKGQKGDPLELVIQVCSRMERMVARQYDTEPLNQDILMPQLARYTEDLEREKIYRLVVLASTTGWDPSTRQFIQGSRPGTAYFNRRALVYLYDFESGELIYNAKDEHASGYAELFSPSLPDEELAEIQEAIKNEMLAHDSLALADALSIFPYKRGMVEAAFHRLAESGRYKLAELPQVGLTLICQV